MAMESVLADDPLSKLAEETSPPFVFTPPTRHTPLKKVASENRGQFPGPSDNVYSFLMVDVVKSSIHINAVKKSATLLSILSPKRSHRRSASLEVSARDDDKDTKSQSRVLSQSGRVRSEGSSTTGISIAPKRGYRATVMENRSFGGQPLFQRSANPRNTFSADNSPSVLSRLFHRQPETKTEAGTSPDRVEDGKGGKEMKDREEDGWKGFGFDSDENKTATHDATTVDELVDKVVMSQIDPVRPKSVWDREDKIAQLLSLVGACFVVGYFRFSMLWVFVLMYGIYHLEKQRKEKSRKSIVNARVNVTPSLFSQTKQKSETTRWLNQLFSVLWPHLHDNIARITTNTMRDIFENSLEKNRPAGVEAISVSHISFGLTPPTFSSISGTKPPHLDYSFDLDTSYFGELQAVIEVTLGGKFLNLRLPISITDLKLSGRLRMDLTFLSRPPYLHTYKCSFLKLPEFQVQIKPMRGVNVLDFPFVEDWIYRTLEHLITTTMVLPNQITILHYRPGDSKVDEVVVDRNEDSEFDGKLALFSDSEDEISRTVAVRGVLYLRLVEARLVLKDEKAVPFVSVYNGINVYNSRLAQGMKSAVWDELMEIPVKREFGQIGLAVKGNTPGNPVDTMIGRVELNTNDLEPDQTKDTWLSLSNGNGEENDGRELTGDKVS
ncbi:hypothetical protein PROFUN_14228 [Planoprotostelium fungivorum]|uniref:Uncharacterized protein n=1 Tax=Planoprotostelium fungivorum TaxID=1890364 RepID=A0A2P6N0S0_9EUKA|nr:hypothetical protein PROFUN_14228 [Planoprotostelium fungivorum]